MKFMKTIIIIISMIYRKAGGAHKLLCKVRSRLDTLGKVTSLCVRVYYLWELCELSIGGINLYRINYTMLYNTLLENEYIG